MTGMFRAWRKPLAFVLMFAMLAAAVPAADAENAGKAAGETVKTEDSTPAQAAASGKIGRSDGEPEDLAQYVVSSKTAGYEGMDEESGDRNYTLTLKASSGATETVTEPGEQITTPADIVLVLDVSASMDEEVDVSGDVYVPFNRWDDGEDRSWGDDSPYDDGDASGYFRRYENYGSYYPRPVWAAVEPAEGRRQVGYSPDADGNFQQSEREAEWKESWWIFGEWQWGSWSDGTPTHILVREGDVQRIDALKSTAYDFVNSLNSGSKVAVKTFTKDNPGVEIGLISLTNEKQAVLDSITNLYINNDGNRGTLLYKGLEKANTALKSSENENQVIVAFTDGEDGEIGRDGSRDDGNQGPTEAEKEAKIAKDKGVRIFTISLLAEKDDEVDGFLTKVSSESDDDDTQYYYSCTDMKGLADAMTEISESAGTTVENPVELKTKSITDTLDPRFELQPGEKARLEEDGAIITVQDGVTKITWKDQTLPVPDEEEWTKEIKIRARSDFLGGNDIPTNVASGSKIVCEDGSTSKFAQPTVNVPVLFSVENKETSIFLGDTVPDAKLQMFDESEWNWYGKGKTGKFSCQWVNKDGDPIENIKALTPFGDSNVYTLKVTFQPDESAKDSKGPRQEAVTESGDYTVNVVRGTVSVTKKIKQSEIWSPNGDPIVTFKLERIVNGSAAETQYRTVRFDDAAKPGQDGTLSLTAAFDDLKKGEYRVTEEDALRYRYQSAGVGEGTAVSEKDGEAVYTYLGYESKTDSTTDVDKKSASAVFTNEAKKLDQPYFSHTDTKSNAIRITFTDQNHTVNPDGSEYVTEQERSAAEKSAEKARPVSAARRPAAELEEEARQQEEDPSEPQSAVETPPRVQPESSSSETAEKSPPPGTSGESRPTEQSPPAEPDSDPSGQQEVRAEDEASAPAKESEPPRETADLPGAKEESE
ncbi:VWFA domain-containing protein [Ruminococcaceae bacterium BL-6]|nr:VWFA domain-containing protein [Ruminococcaceae bacterium BL-6]